ncbi:MAG: hypothetical protein ACO3I1_04065 [Burkholderiales bacterium]
MGAEEDILDLIRLLPEEINNASTTTEFKFLTVGSVLWACHDEIVKLRDEIKELEKTQKKTKRPNRSS